MSLPLPPAPAKLVIGLITTDGFSMDTLAKRLMERCGEIDMVSPWYDFSYTHYYEKEMGTLLKRRFIAFKPLIAQESLADIKIATIEIETAFSAGYRRQVNLDPGYLLLERFVLATGKNFSHRIYLKEGIYADLTLIYSKGAFQLLPWTYPDYQSKEVQLFLTKVRKKYEWDLKKQQTSARCGDLEINQ